MFGFVLVLCSWFYSTGKKFIGRSLALAIKIWFFLSLGYLCEWNIIVFEVVGKFDVKVTSDCFFFCRNRMKPNSIKRASKLLIPFWKNFQTMEVYFTFFGDYFPSFTFFAKVHFISPLNCLSHAILSPSPFLSIISYLWHVLLLWS